MRFPLQEMKILFLISPQIAQLIILCFFPETVFGHAGRPAMPGAGGAIPGPIIGRITTGMSPPGVMM